MKRFYSIAILLLFLVIKVSAQEPVNLNPNPNGEPWYAGKLRKLTEEDYRKIEQTPKLKIDKSTIKGVLPSTIDNSQNKYFRPIFNQNGGSCGQASGIGYNFTYAINFARDLSASTNDNQYPTHYTWNFLNGGADNGSFYFDGWEIINANGCPNVTTYGGMWNGGLTRWMSGYSNYYSAMQNRTLEVFTIDVSTVSGIETLKQWMNDQLNGSAVGGLANFAAGVSGNFSQNQLATGTPEEGKSVVTFWDSEINHAMTFVGYNDSIRYDFNGDGLYTNNKDLNNDGKIDVRDWEKGGVIMVNSWGTLWGDYGKAYVPYKLLAEPSTNGGIMNNLVHVIRAKATYSPKLTIKASITHSSRNKLRITAGVSSDINATKPDYSLQLPIFNYQGGDFYMQGGTTDQDKTIEIGIDVTPLLSLVSSGSQAKYFLVVEERDQYGNANGTINSFSVIDYTNGISETACEQTNVPINNNGTTYLSVNKSIVFDKVQISTTSLPDASEGIPYSFTLNAQNGTAPYKWSFMIDYSEKSGTSKYIPVNTKTLTPGGDDDDIAQLSLPFQFPFYNSRYNNVIVTTDGSILFTDNFEYVRDLPGLMSAKAITVYGSDLMLYPSDGDGIWYYPTKDSITIRWKASKFNQQSFNADFSATLYPSGDIKFNYGNDIAESSDWIAGVSNGDGISYNVATISSSKAITTNYEAKFSYPIFPVGMEISNNGVISYTPNKGDKDWNVTAKVIDINKIYSKKSFTLHSTKSFSLSPDTIKFETTTPDPWQTGKDITITNISNHDFTINSIDWEGNGWYVSNNQLTYPYSFTAGSSLALNVKLKSSFSKSSSMLLDTLNIKTSNSVITVPVIINPSNFTSSVFPITFAISDSKGNVVGAKISIDRITEALITGSDGSAIISLPNGKYNYSISYDNHYPISGNITVSDSRQTITLFLTTVEVESEQNLSVNIYPNPFSDELKLSGVKAGSLLKIYSILGNCILSKKIVDEKETINTIDLPSGIYIIKIEQANGENYLKKMMKR